MEDLEWQTGKRSPWLPSFNADSVAEWHRLCRNLFDHISGGKKPEFKVLTGFGFLLRLLSLVCRQLFPRPQMVSEFAFYYCDEHRDQKPPGVLCTWRYILVHYVGNSGQGLKAGTWRQELRSGRSGGVLLSSLLSTACLVCFLMPPKTTYLPGGGTTPSGLYPPLSIHNQENAPHTCPQSIWWRHLSIKIPFPRQL